MRLVCSLRRIAPDGWLVRHSSREAGDIEVRARTRDEAVAKIEGEIRYRLELCPCTGETYRHIAVEVVESAEGS